jgi:23S rRNA (guanosine2251-2'-O)-methyltransferase
MENIIFGIRPVAEAVEARKQIERVYIKKGAEGQLMNDLKDLMARHHIHWQEVPIEKLNRLTRGNHQGVVAQIAAIDYVEVQDILDRVPEDETPLIVVFDGVTDVRNFGAIARTCECAGVDGIIIPAKNSVTVNADAIKTSAGALHTLPVCREQSLTNTIKFLKDSGFKIVAATEKGDYDYSKANYMDPTCIIMGAEDKGVSYEHLALCDEWIKIPMKGTIESLNVSVAAGVLIYEAVKQRGFAGEE